MACCCCCPPPHTPLTAVSPPCPHNSLRNAMPMQWVAHATNTGVVKAPVIAQKCPQEGRVGRREAAARGCPRRQQCGLGFVQVSCPLEHTSNPAASVAFFLCPPATCQPACCFPLPIETFSGSCTMCTWVGSGVRLRYNTRTHTPNNGAVWPYSTGNSTEMPTGKHYGPQGSRCAGLPQAEAV